MKSYKHTIQILLIGQILSLLNALSQVFGQYLADLNTTLPGLRLTFVYFCLSLCLPVHLYYYGWTPKHYSVLVIIFILAIIDVEANYLVVKAFDMSYFVVVGLLLNFTVIFSAIFGYIFFQRRFTKQHIFGGIIALSGLVLVFFDNYDSSEAKESRYSIIGNVYVILGAMLYSVSNLVFEYLLKMQQNTHFTLEFLGCLGTFAFIISAIQTYGLESTLIKNVAWDSSRYLYIAGFVAVVVSFYLTSSYFLRVSEASLFSLNLLTADVFNVFFCYFLFSQSLSVVYWIALILGVAGIALYSLKDVQDKYTVDSASDYLTFDGTKSIA